MFDHHLDGGAPHTGTTIVACEYDGGVVLGADTRVSTGTYVSNRASDKMVALNDCAIMCRSGSAADTEALASYVMNIISQHEMEIDGKADVKTVATIANRIGYQNKGMNNGQGMSAYTIVGGWDSRRGAQVYACTAGGNMIKERWTTDGSGSTYIWGFLDDGYRANMTRDECEKFVAKAIALAMSIDSSSGGCIRLNTVDATGITRTFIQGNDIPPVLGELPQHARGPTVAIHGHRGVSGGMIL
jgi:20S proteasome subunit beta 1